MTQLFAQPYDISARGFYFTSAEEYRKTSAGNRNALGSIVEEYEIHFIDGTDLDAQLSDALGINQANVAAFLAACENWDEPQKQKAIIAVRECGYSFDLESGNPDDFEIDIYEMDSLRKLAEHFVDEGLFGEIPDRLQYYLDYDAIARDLSMDYSETVIAGKHFIYRCS